jgi:hypothetical protein
MRRTFAEGVAQFNREAGGLLHLEIILQKDHHLVLKAACDGDPLAFSRMQALLESRYMIRNMARKKPAVCLTCPRSIHDPNASLALLVPATNAATVAICSALCEKCSKYEPEIITKLAASAFRAAWPSLQCVEVEPSGGPA